MATTGRPIAQATIQELAAAIATAINQSGGNSGRGYNPVSAQASKQADPASRVAEIRSYKTSQTSNNLMRELATIQNSANRSTHDMQRLLEFNRKTLAQAINKYENFTEAQQALVKQFQSQLHGSSASVQALAGSIEKLEDVFAFSDAAKAAAELSKSIKSSVDTGQNVEDVIESLNALKGALPNGKTLQDVDGSLDALDKRLQGFLTAQNAQLVDGKYKFHDAAGNARSAADQARLDKALLGFIKNGSVARKATVVADDLAMQSNATVTRATTATMNTFNTVMHEASSRVEQFMVKAASAAFVLDKLADAAKHLYATLKAAASTGTQRTFSEVFGREVRTLVNGVSVEAVNKAQTEHARQRRAGGTQAYDQALYDGKSDFFRLTGDLDEALLQAANTMDIVGTTGASMKVARVATKNLTETFNELTMLTGMTVGELNAMNKEITDNYTFRQSLQGLDERARSESIRNLDLMMKENVLRGISIQQSKDMQKAREDIANPWSPRARMKNAAMLRLQGGAYGVNTESIARATQAGGLERYRTQLTRQGLTKQAVDEEIKRVQDQELKLGTTISEKLSRGDSDSYATEKIGEKMPAAFNPYYTGKFDATATKPQAIIGEAADEFKEGSKDFLAGVVLFTGNWLSNFSKSVIGTVIIGVGGFLLSRLILSKLGGMSMMSAIPAFAGAVKAAIPGILGGMKNLVTPGRTLETIKAAGPAIMGGMSSMLAAVKAMRTPGATIPPVTPAAPSPATTAAGRAAGAAVPPNQATPRPVTPAAPSPATTAAGRAANAAIPPTQAPRPGTKAERRAARRAERRAAERAARAGVPPTPAAGIPGAPPVPVAGGRLASVGNFLKGGFGLSLVGLGADVAGNAMQDSGHVKTGAGAKILGSAASGAGLGATVGSFIPVLGTGIGAAVGGTIGAGLGLYNNFADLIGSTPTVPNPTQPSVNRPPVNTPSEMPTSSNPENKMRQANVPLQDTPEDKMAKATLALNGSLGKMNSTLDSILTELKNSKTVFTDKSDASLELQKQLRRAVKGSNILGDPTPASQAYNV